MECWIGIILISKANWNFEFRMLNNLTLFFSIHRQSSTLHTIQNAFARCDDRTVGAQIVRHTFSNFAWLEIVRTKIDELRWLIFDQRERERWKFRLHYVHYLDLHWLVHRMAWGMGRLGVQLVVLQVEDCNRLVLGDAPLAVVSVFPVETVATGNACPVAQRLDTLVLNLSPDTCLHFHHDLPLLEYQRFPKLIYQFRGLHWSVMLLLVFGTPFPLSIINNKLWPEFGSLWLFDPFVII